MSIVAAGVTTNQGIIAGCGCAVDLAAVYADPGMEAFPRADRLWLDLYLDDFTLQT